MNSHLPKPSSIICLVALAASNILIGTAGAQLAASGTAGDRAVYTIGAGATLGTGLGNSVTHDFDTETLADNNDSFELGADGGADDTKVFLTGGHHLVIYGTQYENTESARGAAESVIRINGGADPSPYGASAGYFRNNNADELFCRGGTILEVAQGDYIEIETARTDDHQQTLNQVDADLQLVKLGEFLDYLRIRRADTTQIMAANEEGPVTVPFNAQDEIDAGSFAHDTGTNPDQITLNSNGQYLVLANTGIFVGIPSQNQRQSLTQEVMLAQGGGGAAAVPGGTTTVYLRHSATDGAGGAVDEGAASVAVIVEVTNAPATLSVQITRDNIDSGATISVDHERTGLAIAKLPGFADTISLTGAAQDINTAAATVRDFSATPDVTTTSFSYASATSASRITVNQPADYLFLGSYYVSNANPAGTTRSIIRQAFETTPSGGSAAPVIYGAGGAYNRDDQDGADRARDGGSWAGAVLSLSNGDAVETTTQQIGQANPINSSLLSFQALNITGISAPPNNPVLGVNTGLTVLKNVTGTVITTAMLETIDGDTDPADLEYILTTEPTGGMLFRDGVQLTIMNPFFDQQDINDGLITFDAGATESIGGGFSFEVDDGGGSEVSATFTINVVDPTAVVADAGATDEDSAIDEGGLSTGATLLDNDGGSGLVISSADTVSANGAAVTVNSDGTFDYDPTVSATLQGLGAGDAAVADTFDFVVQDLFGVSHPSTATITVSALNDAPMVVNEQLSGGESTLYSLNLLANDSDADTGDTLSLATFDGGALGTLTTALGATVTVSADGSFTYDPTTSATLLGLGNGVTADDVLAYEVTDGTTNVGGTVTITTVGEAGASGDLGTVDAGPPGTTTTITVLANDNISSGAVAATPGAIIQFLAADGNSSSGSWANSGTTSAATPSRAVEPGAVLLPSGVNVIDNAPPGVLAAYSFDGGLAANGDSGMTFLDVGDNGAWAGGGEDLDLNDATIEVVFRPADQDGTEVLFETGGNTVGSSLVLIDDQIVFTVSDANGSALQAVAPLPADAVAGGEFVHLLATVNLATDTIEIYLNNILRASATGQIDLSTGAPNDLTDWSGTDDGGIGTVSNAIGGDLSTGQMGTLDINAGAVDFVGEVTAFRIYGSILTPIERNSNFEAVFGEGDSPTVTNIIEVAGETTLVPGTTVVNLPSGATVTLESDGGITYDPNGAFDDIGVGLTATDTFTYRLDSFLNQLATVTVTVNGTNTDPQITITRTSPASVTEGTSHTFTVNSSALVAGDDVEVSLSISGTATSGVDYTGPGGGAVPLVATIFIGDDETTLTLDTVVDALFEGGAEEIVLEILSIDGGTAVLGSTLSATATIDDGDAPPVFTISGPGAAVPEGEVAAFTVDASVASTVAVDINLLYPGTNTATAELDYLGGAATITLPAGAGSTSIPLDLPTCPDLVADDGETLEVTISGVSVGTVGAMGTAGTTISDVASELAFEATFEGVTVSPPNGVNAPQAANEGTQVGSWSNVPAATSGGAAPGVEPDSSDISTDVKGDGIDNLLRVDRPGPADLVQSFTDLTAEFASPLDFSGANTAAISLDLGQVRTQTDTDAKNNVIRGLDADGNVSFELVVNANNTPPTGNQLYHSDGDGNLTSLGQQDDFDNTQDSDTPVANVDNEKTLTTMKLILGSGGFRVAQDIFPVDGVYERVSGLLPYVDGSTATQVDRVVISISTSTDTLVSGGILLDDVRAIGILGNQPPALSLGGANLADSGTTGFPNITTSSVLNFTGGTVLGLSDPDSGAAIVTLRLQATAGLGTIDVPTLDAGTTVSAGANPSADMTLSGTAASINATLAGGVTYNAGGTGGTETLQLTADDGGATGAPATPLTATHGLQFLVSENPIVTVNQAASQSDPTTVGTIDFTAVFSEAVDGLDGSDVDFTGSTAPGVLSAAVSTADNITYNIEVSGMSGDGDVVVSIPAGAAFRALPATGPNEASDSTDNSVSFELNLPPVATNLDQEIAYTPAGVGTIVDIDEIFISDGNEALTSGIATGTAARVDHPAVDTATKFVAAVPTVADGFAWEIRFTPDAADVAPGGGVGSENRRVLMETGGTSNGSGLFLVDGIVHFGSKMNSTPADSASSFNDTDWGDTAGAVVMFPLHAAPLPAGEVATVAVIFDLDSLRFAVNGSQEMTQALPGRAGQTDWSGDETISIGAAGGAGSLSDNVGSFLETDYIGLNVPGSVDYARMFNVSGAGADISTTVITPDIITATLTVDNAGAGTLTATDGGSGALVGGSGTEVLAITGNSAQVNAALATVQFVTTAGTSISETVSVLIDDGDEDNTPAGATGTIELNEQQTALEDWRVANGFQADGSGPGEGNLDRGPNGYTNLTNFALGFDAVGANSDQALVVTNPGPGGTITQHGGPSIWIDPNDGKRYLRYTRRADFAAAGLTIVEQYSKDLATWEADAAAVPVVIGTGTGDLAVAIEAVQVELPDPLPVAGGTAQQARLDISIAP